MGSVGLLSYSHQDSMTTPLTVTVTVTNISRATGTCHHASLTVSGKTCTCKIKNECKMCVAQARKRAASLHRESPCAACHSTFSCFPLSSLSFFGDSVSDCHDRLEGVLFDFSLLSLVRLLFLQVARLLRVRHIGCPASSPLYEPMIQIATWQCVASE